MSGVGTSELTQEDRWRPRGEIQGRLCDGRIDRSHVNGGDGDFVDGSSKDDRIIIVCRTRQSCRLRNRRNTHDFSVYRTHGRLLMTMFGSWDKMQGQACVKSRAQE